jgi:hypothetical protein
MILYELEDKTKRELRKNSEVADEHSVVDIVELETCYVPNFQQKGHL